MAQATSSEGSQNNLGSPPRSTELHSPLSPLSPGSPVYPDGVFTTLWLAKHQQQVPALFIAFFDIVAAGTINSNQDEQFKADINAIRASLNRSGFKTKFAAVLISDRSILQAPELEDRLLSLRRATSLDSKTGLFFLPPMSSIETTTFVQGMLTTLQPLCIDYYRDLTKHARRKKARVSSASLPSPGSGSAQPLSVSGWNVRYEVKQGVFAEFRQEMETAERHYSAAIDELFGTEGMLEFYSSSSPRWNEARLLCDILALRILRCQLWTSSTTGAAQSWVNYKVRVADLVNRRGKGLRTYGWQAWKARWAELMAQLVDRADLPAFIQSDKQQDQSVEVPSGQIYAMPEKTLTAAERLPPFQNLHHSGYWFKIATKGSQTRRDRALEIPEEDRMRQSSAFAIATRTTSYDSYLVPEPHEESPLSTKSKHDHVADIARLTEAAIEQFKGKSQTRMTELVKLDIAHDFVDAERYSDAMEMLTPLWDETTWRDDSWHDLLTDLLLLLRQCAERVGNSEVILGTTYELLSSRSRMQDGLSLDLAHCLDGMQEASSTVISLKIQDQQRLSPLAVSFAFEMKETHVGEPLGCQLSLTSCMNDKSAPLTLSSVTLLFGTSKVVKIVHDSTAEATSGELVDLFEITEASEGSFEAKANLTLRTTERRIFKFILRFRDALVIRLTQVVLSIQTEKFAVQHSFTDHSLLASDSIFLETDGTLERRFLRNTDTTAVTVLPKPPKVQILMHGLRKEYYTDEIVRLGVVIVNAEGQPVSGKVSAQVNDERENTGLALQWGSIEQETDSTHDESQLSVDSPIARMIPLLNTDGSHIIHLSVTAPPDPLKTTIEIAVDYTLSTDKNSTLRKSTTLELNVVAPFEAKFNFGPLLYPDAWPSYFDPNGGTTVEQPGGIPQLWRLSSQLRSLAMKRIVLHKVEVVVDSVAGDSHARTENQNPEDEHTLEPGKISRYSFSLQTQKYSLDDRRPTAMESTLSITWSRSDSSQSGHTTRIPVPRLTLPVSEPRVLCTLTPASNIPPSGTDGSSAILHYHIENPSTHFLTFALTMEASEDFAFSGPKYRALSLAPMSRVCVEYCIALHSDDDAAGGESSEGGMWISPSLQVIDSYYQKTLRVHPGGEGVRVDEKGGIGVWVETF